MEWFGDPLGDDGAHFVSFSDTRPSEIIRELALVAALKNGAEDSRDLRLEIELFAREREKPVLAEARARGVSECLRALLVGKRKRDIEKIAREIVIKDGEFHDFLRNCSLLGLSKHSDHYEWIPDGRGLTPEDRADLFESGGADPGAVGKVRQLFQEREHRSVHMFTSPNGQRWHCFYLTFKDVGGDPTTREHHWSEGPHVHFVNYLFNPQKVTRRWVLSALSERAHSVKSVHLRYEVRREKPDTGQRLYADPEVGRITKVQIGRPTSSEHET